MVDRFERYLQEERAPGGFRDDGGLKSYGRRGRAEYDWSRIYLRGAPWLSGDDGVDPSRSCYRSLFARSGTEPRVRRHSQSTMKSFAPVAVKDRWNSALSATW